MFFNTGAGVAPRESAGVRTLESGAGLRRALLVGTILSAGVMLQPGVGRAQTVTNITSPITGSAAGVADDQPTSSDNLAITVSAPVTSTANAAIVATRGPGSISVTNNAALNALTNGVYATSVSGAVTVTGTGDITSTGFSEGSLAGEGIYAKSASGSVTISGTGATSAAGVGIRALIDSGTGDISISRSGLLTSGANGDAGKEGILANNAGSGAIMISGIGAVTATGVGVSATATGGAITIGASAAEITNAISGTQGIKAANTGSGTISIATGTGGTVTGTGSSIVTEAVDGDTTISLGDAVTGGTVGHAANFSEAGV
jgi:hypothetical protein